jgi:hypothetical protein
VDATCAAVVLAAAHMAGVLTPAYAAGVCAEAAACVTLLPLFTKLLYEPPAAVLRLLADVETCPPGFLRRWRDASVNAGAHLRRRFFDDVALFEAQHTTTIFCCLAVAVYKVCFCGLSVRDASLAMTTIVAVLFGSSCAAKLHHSSTRTLASMSAQLAAETRAQTLEELRARLASSSSETANLRAGCEACLALFPGAVACALGAFAEGGASCDVISTLECGARDAASRAVLAASLPAHVGADRLSSVARACGATANDGCALLDSRQLPLGMGACSDWQRVITGGVAGSIQSAAAITAPVCAGPVLVGFLTIHFGLFDNSPPGSGDIRELCDAIGGAVFVRRAFATSEDAFNAGLYAAGVPMESGGDDDEGGAVGGAPARQRSPPGRNSSPRHRPPRSSLLSGDGGLRTPSFGRLQQRTVSRDSRSSTHSSEQHDAALDALDASAAADWALLLDWGLDAAALPPGEACRLLSAMMHSLGLLQRFRISVPAFQAFIQDVERHYSADNPFHHFGHATQARRGARAQGGAAPCHRLRCSLLFHACSCRWRTRPGCSSPRRTCAPCAGWTAWTRWRSCCPPSATTCATRG